MQGGTSAKIYGDRFGLLIDLEMKMSGVAYEDLESTAFIRCRFGAHDPVVGTLEQTDTGVAFISCLSSDSYLYGRVTTGYEFVSVAINGQNFLPALDGPGGCYENPDACARFKSDEAAFKV